MINEAFRKCYAKGCNHNPKGSCVTCKKFFELKEEDEQTNSTTGESYDRREESTEEKFSRASARGL